jgi:hypothetical protein
MWGSHPQVKKVSNFTESHVRSLETDLDQLNDQVQNSETREADRERLEEVSRSAIVHEDCLIDVVAMAACWGLPVDHDHTIFVSYSKPPKYSKFAFSSFDDKSNWFKGQETILSVV